MRILIRDLAPGQQYGIAFRSNDGHGGTSDWSQVTKFTTTSDTMPPANVLNLGLFTQDASYFATWDKVTTNHDGTPLLDFASYHVHVASVGGSGTGDFYPTTEHFEFTKAQNLATFGNFQTALTFTLTAVDKTHNESVLPNSLAFDPAQPANPSTPIVSNYIGLLQVAWDTLNSVGGGMPSNFSYCEVHVSTTSGFTPTSATLAGTLNLTTPKYVIAGLTYGTTYYVRLVAVNALGKKSNPSVQASGSPQRITGLDIQNGQISAEQINWVATGIPGGNAYYSTTAPPGGTYTTNDIWYDTSNAYTPHHWTGSVWGGAATDVGFIVGTKILAGTLTANAIGTNQIITASANIANAVIDDAHISNVSAAKITAGTVSSAIVVAGRLTTALTGARVEVNSSGVQQFASDGVTKLVDISGGNATITGTFQTSTSGRRLVLAGSSSLGEIAFIPASYTGTAPNNKWAYIVGQTEGDGVTEDIQMGLSNATRWATPGSLWNKLNLNSQGWTNLQSEKVDFTFSNTGNFVVRQSSDFGVTSGVKMNLDNSGFYFYDNSGQTRIEFQEGSTLALVRKVGETFAIYDYNPTGGTTSARLYLDDTGTVTWFWPGTNARLIFPGANNINNSPAYQMVDNAGYGVTLRFGENSDHSGQHLAIGDAAETTFQPVSGGLYTNASSAVWKTDIEEANLRARDALRQVKPKTYRRKSGQTVSGEVIPPGPVELGFIAEELPEEVLTYHNGKLIGIATSSLDAMIVAYVQELDAMLEAALTRIEQLESKIDEQEDEDGII